MVSPSLPKRRRWWLLALPTAAGLAFGAIILNVALRGDSQNESTVRSSTTPIVAFGFVDLENRVRKLNPAVPGGQVSEVLCREGESVPGGAVLLRLDDTLAKKKVDEAAAAVESAKAALERGKALPEEHRLAIQEAQAGIAAAEAQREAARIEYERNRSLQQKDLATPQMLAIAEQQWRAAQESVRMKQTELDRLKLKDPKNELRVLQSQVNAAEALYEQAKAQLKQYTVVAPAAGSVLSISVGVGDTIVVGPGSPPAIEFCPQGAQVIRAGIEQAYAGLVAAGQRVIIEDDAHGPGKWTGRVKRVAGGYAQQRPVLNPDPTQFSDQRTLECIIEIDENPQPLRINQRVQVTIEVPSK